MMGHDTMTLIEIEWRGKEISLIAPRLGIEIMYDYTISHSKKSIRRLPLKTINPLSISHITTATCPDLYLSHNDQPNPPRPPRNH